MTLAPAEELQADTDDSNGGYVIGLARVLAIAFGTGLAGFALNRLRRFRRSGAHPYRKDSRNA